MIDHRTAGRPRTRVQWRSALATPERKAFAFLLTGLALYLGTVSPTLYLLDSPEFAIGAAQLGIVHSPGYPLYLMIAHLFTLLPIGDIAFRVNLMSAVALAISLSFVFLMLTELVRAEWAAACATLMFGLSYYVWASGVAAEVYAPQLVTCAILGYTLVRLYLDTERRETWALRAGGAFGIAVAMHPSSALLAPGMAAAFLALPLTWRRRVEAGLLSAVIVAACALYFPLRFAAQPALNLAGQYDASGTFQPIALNTLEGVWWMLRGAQFSRLFWSGGLPSVEQLRSLLLVFWNNYLGVGFLLGVPGLMVMARRARLLAVWLAFFVPYTYFYLMYDVPDRNFMLGPSLLLWTIPLAFGLRWCLEGVSRRIQGAVAVALPLVFLATNLPLLNLSHDTSVRTRAEATLDVLPEGAYVFGDWLEIVPVQYLTMIEHQRTDLKVYNLFLFDKLALNQYVGQILLSSDRPVVFLSQLEDSSLNLDLLDTTLYQQTTLEIPGDETAVAAVITRRGS